MPLTIHQSVPSFETLGHLNVFLRESGCVRCDLGFQKNINGCCVSRGNMFSTKMIVGEGPGKDEDSTRKPFTGPAGRLMDRIWASVGMDTNDWYLTNVVLCRPVAPSGSGKQNLTPKVEQKDRCSPFLWQQIDMLSPSIIVTVGAVATAAILGQKYVRMGDYRGRLIRGKRFLHYPMLHPAAILHAQKDPHKHLLYRQQTWEDIQRLKSILQEEKIDAR